MITNKNLKLIILDQADQIERRLAKRIDLLEGKVIELKAIAEKQNKT